MSSSIDVISGQKVNIHHIVFAHGCIIKCFFRLTSAEEQYQEITDFNIEEI